MCRCPCGNLIYKAGNTLCTECTREFWNKEHASYDRMKASLWDRNHVREWNPADDD